MPELYDPGRRQVDEPRVGHGEGQQPHADQRQVHRQGRVPAAGAHPGVDDGGDEDDVAHRVGERDHLAEMMLPPACTMESRTSIQLTSSSELATIRPSSTVRARPAAVGAASGRLSSAHPASSGSGEVADVGDRRGTAPRPPAPTRTRSTPPCRRPRRPTPRPAAASTGGRVRCADVRGRRRRHRRPARRRSRPTLDRWSGATWAGRLASPARPQRARRRRQRRRARRRRAGWVVVTAVVSTTGAARWTSAGPLHPCGRRGSTVGAQRPTTPEGPTVPRTDKET